jgi:hypothetical protein
MASKPKSAVPSYLLNGTPQPNSRKREREKLTSSIESTYGRRVAANPENEKEGPSVKRRKEESEVGDRELLSQPARDPRDEAPITPPASSSRPASPYTLQPPIDYDGLSWPSMFCYFRIFRMKCTDGCRCWYTRTTRCYTGASAGEIGENRRGGKDNTGVCGRGRRAGWT